MLLKTFVLVAVAVFVTSTVVFAQERVLRAELDTTLKPAEVWAIWTTEQGLRSFFAPAARIDPVVDGDFEILFSPEKPAGERGAEGLRIVAFEPMNRFAFTWNAPQDQPTIRAQRTIVEVRLTPTSSGTHLTFLHWGWGTGPEWDKAYGYFDQAWNTFVLPMLQHRLAHGPIDWTRPPSLKPLTTTLKHELKISAPVDRGKQ